MSRVIRVASTGHRARFRILDQNGDPWAGVPHNAAGLTLWYTPEIGAKVSLALSAETWHDDGAGWYRFDVPDSVYATLLRNLSFAGTITGGTVWGEDHDVVAYDPYAVAVGAAVGGTPMSLVDDAVTAAKIASNALNGKGDWSTVTPTNLTAQEVWEHASRTLSGFGFQVTVGHSDKLGPYRITKVIAARHARTPWLFVVDVDDISVPTRAWESVATAERHGCEMVGGHMIQWMDDETEELAKRISLMPHWSSGVIYETAPLGMLTNPTRCVSLDAFQRLNGFESWLMAADFEFDTRAQLSGVKTYKASAVWGLRRLCSTAVTLDPALMMDFRLQPAINDPTQPHRNTRAVKLQP